jgi:hypothetical protein
VLGDGIGRDDEGAFRGNGSWQATKLFLQRPGLEAELFFNFDLAHKRGEFAEKDSDYASDLLAFMALELRDGPPAPLTPDNDARISLLGPKPDATRPIGPPDARFLRFEAKSQRLLYAAPDAGGTRVASVAVEGDPRELQLIRLEHELSLLECAAGSDDPCLVEESTPDKPHVISSKDKKSLFLLERAHQRVTPLSGPWGEQGHLSSASVSPDGNWLAVHGLRPKAKPPTNFQVLYLLRTSAPQPALEVSQGEEWLEVVGWFGAGAQTRAVVRVGLSYDKDVKPKWLALDPKTGEKVELAKAPDGVAADDTLSPDGKRRFSCQGDNAVVITDVATGAEHKFPIAARERRAFAEECALAWRGSRYLSYAPERTGFIDVDTLKLSFPFAEGAEPEPQEYDPSFSWLVTKPDKQLEIARLVVR